MSRLIAFEILDSQTEVAINPNRVQSVVHDNNNTKIVLADGLVYTVKGSFADVVGRLNCMMTDY